MEIEETHGGTAMKKKTLSIILSFGIALATSSMEGCGKARENQAQTSSAQPGQASQQAPAATPATPTPDQLYQLVAPIALFPDNLVAQVLAASTYPDQVTAAHTWLQQNSNLKGDQLMQTVNQQSWDASIKALTQFPDVLNQMATNLSWTSALGDAYFNFPKDVMNAVQVMRQRAYDAGNLKSNQQQSVSVQNQAPGSAPAPAQAGSAEPQTTIVQPPPQTIVVQPAQPQVVYVPTYNPAVVYGAPVAVYPGYVAPPSTGALIATGLISFGVGMAVGAAMSNSCCGWGWNSWGCGWHNSTVVYNRNVYVSNSNTFVNRNNYYNRNVNNVNRNNVNVNNVNRNNVNRNNINTNNVNRSNYRADNFHSNAPSSNFSSPNFGTKYNQPQYQNTRANANGGANNRQLGASNQPNFNQPNRTGANQSRPQNLQQQRQPSRGYEQQANRGTSSGAFSNYGQGGNARTNSARGQQSFEARGGGGGAGRRR
jgi:hypothetical protein